VLPSPTSATARVAVLLAAIALVLAGCAGSGASPTPTTSPVAAAATATPAPTATAVATASSTAAPAYPLTLTDDEGTSVEIKAEPQKIVSLTPAVTETLFAVGAGDRVVAADDSSDYPPEAKDLLDVVTFGTVDVEKIVALEPDLVIAGGAGFTSADAIAQLRTLGIPVLVVSTPSIEGIYKDIELVGTAVARADAATDLTATMQKDMEAIATAAKAESAKTAKPPRVFYDVGYLDATGQIYGPGEGSFLAEMVGMLGVDVITGDKVTYEVPLETLVERDPEVIILGVNAFYTPTAETGAKRPGWSKLTASKNGDVRSVSATESTRPGPRLATGMRNLALAMYPDLVLPAGS
jgi:iron complex transport system substrate-binding protein